ncbi:phosphoribosylformylglycinamidine synthase subunit PurS [Marinithermus hydrothermalis]|uniref:Phosphoribosylformylglycinamidine synthase subunit PurS n=1 Tax=Marinithermus hydrothermalis (strain DSM 14884 / JCM 11576 / T1) TaxID=869210 RepID=F2NNU2_MARHT|nr:phosphoribosylformylglycinamidine synthase subunit PurS [Marinithermus hydrothermalis]AEB11316.1 phosphoribosylformylglycinamidine synthase, purS [Marinithermus hydrothermalis DSM 14884]
MTYHATILVELKEGILDPQGRALEGVLNRLGFNARNIQVGKVIELELDASSEEEARQQVERMASTITNPVMEVFTYQLKAVEVA